MVHGCDGTTEHDAANEHGPRVTKQPIKIRNEKDTQAQWVVATLLVDEPFRGHHI
jgi:hypothetical protein